MTSDYNFFYVCFCMQREAANADKNAAGATTPAAADGQATTNQAATAAATGTGAAAGNEE